MKPQLSFRYEVTKGDIATVKRIVESTGVFNAPEVGIAIELVEARLDRGDASDYFFVFAEENGTVLGYTCYGPIPATDKRYEMYWIAIDKALQRSGLGRALLIETEKQIAAVGGKRIYVETSSTPTYEATRTFYSKNGYALEARLKGYHFDDDDLCIYLKTI